MSNYIQKGHKGKKGKTVHIGKLLEIVTDIKKAQVFINANITHSCCATNFIPNTRQLVKSHTIFSMRVGCRVNCSRPNNSVILTIILLDMIYSE